MSLRFAAAQLLGKSGSSAAVESRAKRSEPNLQIDDGVVNRFLSYASLVASSSLYTKENTPTSTVQQRAAPRHGQYKKWTSVIARQLEEWEEEVEREVRGQRYKDLKEAFHTYDVDGSGSISAKELRTILRY